MIARLKLSLGIGLVSIAIAGSAYGCSLASVPGAQKAIAAEGRIDGILIDKAIRAEVNYFRCRAGLSPVAAAEGLRKVADQHARWMARAGKLSHHSSNPGRRTPLARLKASGLKVRLGSENIGQTARYQIDGRRFRIEGRDSCNFLNSSGHVIPPHSYGSLAHAIVTLWMESGAHRHNILDRKASRMGAGVGFDARAPYCGNYYISQTFAG